MEKPIIAIDLDGALMRSRPFDNAHKEWFKTMASLLNDSSILEYAKLREAKDYFPKVHEIMARYLGNVDEQTKNLFARNLYAMSILAEVKQQDLVNEFADFLKKLKEKYRLALITTIPEIIALPILEKVKFANVFDYLRASPITQKPNKKELFEKFIKEHGKPAFYIGNGDKDIEACKELGIKSISVRWVSQGKIKGDFDISTIKELKNIVN